MERLQENEQILRDWKDFLSKTRFQVLEYCKRYSRSSRITRDSKILKRFKEIESIKR